MYREEDLIAIARRENNPKRGYLVVNRLQGKHIPAHPGEVLGLFGRLADRIEELYRGERLLLVGFAETATAIGAALAIQMNTDYIQTTRETRAGANYLHFCEAHSHAVEQKLDRTALDGVIKRIDRVVFVEDEVTTGNTILNIVEILRECYGNRIHFSVASLLNGMNREALELFEERGIGVHYLMKTCHDAYADIAGQFKSDGDYFPCDRTFGARFHLLEANGVLDARSVVRGARYQEACENLWEQIQNQIPIGSGGRILAAGTEEFMYPALFVAHQAELLGNDVRCHATTRSPIVVCRDETYPLHTRYELASMYDCARRTFLYNIGTYDKVIVVTDAQGDCSEGMNALANALAACGNREIYMVRWR